jgi:glycosyltransferase involved in cell wall biosynthesis/ubiquinone/menaquinone biosynthesis C-methylase UbiE
MTPDNGTSLATEALVTEVLVACGTGRILSVGDDASLVRSFLRAGADAYSLHTAAGPLRGALRGRLVPGDLRRLPFSNNAFDVVVAIHCLERVDEADLQTAIAELRRVARRSLFLRIAAPSSEGTRTTRSRSDWESRLFAAGFRKHPAYYEANDYESLQADGDGFDLVMEGIPIPAAHAYPLASLAAERDLHMDMTRESGARSDAHIIRYQLAGRYVRPGDNVLDAACGLGYGAHLLQTRTMAKRTLGIDASAFGIEYATRNFADAMSGLEFRAGELPQCLDSLPDHSIDFIACFETLEHVHDPPGLLAAFARILAPAGRIVASVPNDWSDESGRDPNPFHFHVYDWPRLRSELGQHFILEAVYEQTASRRKVGKSHRSWAAAERRLRKIEPSALVPESTPDCEWWIAVGMKDPVAGRNVPYRESAYQQATSIEGWHAVAFARDYVNPWIVRGMVTIGQRMTDDAALLELARRVGRDSPEGSADAGAVMTVESYRALADPELSVDTVASLDRCCAAYLAAASDDVPHQKRWTVSILFVLAQLWQAVGIPERASGYYEACSAEDALAFSPLLATKTVEAALRLALLRMSAGDVDGSRVALRQGIAIAERALRSDWSAAVGDRDHPVDFGLPELAAVMEQASACAFALGHFDLIPDKPGLWWWQHQRNRLSEIHRVKRSEASLHAQAREVRMLHGVLAGKHAALVQQATEIHRLEDVVTTKDASLAEQAEEIHRLENVLATKDAALAEQSAEIHRTFSVIAEKDAALIIHAAEVARLREMLESSERSAAAHAAENRRTNEQLRAAHAEGDRLGGELAAIRGSKWHTLGEALRRKPLDAAALREVARLSSGMIRKRWRSRAVPLSVPPAAEPAAVPATAAARSAPPPFDANEAAPIGTSLPALQPYVIRLPVPRNAPRPRILHALANFMTGGSSRLVVDLVERLGADYEQRILTSFVPTPPGYVGAEIAVLSTDASEIDFVEALRVADPMLLHVHYWGDCDEPWYRRVFAAAEALGVDVLENVNTPVAPYRSPSVAQYVYVSQYVRDAFGSVAYPEDVVHPGSDLSMFAQAPASSGASDTIGMVYRLERDKLDDRSIEPLIRAVQRRPGTRALVVGGGSLLESFKSQVDKAGLAARFTFTGFVAYESLPGLYASMALFVAPVAKESFGQVSVFAMSMGVPVVGYATGAIPEIVEDAALVAPAGDSDALAGVIVGLLDDAEARRRIGARNRQRAHARYSVEAMIARYRDFYASLIGARV